MPLTPRITGLGQQLGEVTPRSLAAPSIWSTAAACGTLAVRMIADARWLGAVDFAMPKVDAHPGFTAA